jgi:hypothetical protein
MTSVAEKLQRKSQRQTSTKQVRLRLVYVDFWSITKLSALIWACLGIVLVVATFLVWSVLSSTGIFEQIDAVLTDVLGENSGFSVAGAFGLGQVVLFSFVIAVLNLVVGTVLGAIGALLYNLAMRITGGLLVGFTNT